MKKMVLLSAVLALIVTSSYAQLSTRENEASVNKLGARPVAGDMALNFNWNFGSPSAKFPALFKGNLLNASDLLTFRYFLADDMVIRAGLRFFKDGDKSNGTGADSTVFYDPNMAGNIQTAEYKRGHRQFVFVPGIEKHFSGSNIFDVYVGSDLYVGLGKNDSLSNVEWRDGDFFNQRYTTSTTIAGLGLIAGFNIFIADLPISVGLEYGLDAIWTIGGKTKVALEQRIGNNNASAEYYVQDTDPFGNPDPVCYSKLSKGSSFADTNQNIKISINIYFGQ